jgi:hypothetical protein
MQGVEEAENKRLREENKTKKFAERGVWDKNKNKNLTEEVYRERVSERKKQKQNQVVRREREREGEWEKKPKTEARRLQESRCCGLQVPAKMNKLATFLGAMVP